MLCNTENYCVFGLCPSFIILKSGEYDVSENLYSFVSRIPNDEQSPEIQ
jgi:hypothetical protein